MKEFRVRWEIDIEAASPREAAQEVLDIQRDPQSIATVFEVTDRSTDQTTTIDLHDPQYEAEPTPICPEMEEIRAQT